MGMATACVAIRMVYLLLPGPHSAFASGQSESRLRGNYSGKRVPQHYHFWESQRKHRAVGSTQRSSEIQEGESHVNFSSLERGRTHPNAERS